MNEITQEPVDQTELVSKIEEILKEGHGEASHEEATIFVEEAPF